MINIVIYTYRTLFNLALVTHRSDPGISLGGPLHMQEIVRAKTKFNGLQKDTKNIAQKIRVLRIAGNLTLLSGNHLRNLAAACWGNRADKMLPIIALCCSEFRPYSQTLNLIVGTMGDDHFFGLRCGKLSKDRKKS
jgi:hypothetical protein